MSSRYPMLPIARPKPDAPGFIDYLMGRAAGPGRMVEYLVDEALREPIGRELLGQAWIPGKAGGRESTARWLDNYVDFWHRMGYDYVRFEQGLPLPTARKRAADTAIGVKKERVWADQHHGMIASWDDFERYPWPRIEDYDFFTYDYLDAHLPDGFGLIVSHAGGIFEVVSSILSLEGLCFLLHDDPALVKAVTDRVGALLAAMHAHFATLPHVIAHFQGDDMGHKTGTLISPKDLRAFFLPWHKRFAEIAHGAGRPYFVHSCGDMFAVIEELIDDVRIDGKHSYEDIIIPIEEFQRRYGHRVAVLGGMDIDRLARGTVDEVRRHTRYLMETCSPRGRFAVGSGSSIASYIPVENYLAMLDEALAFRTGN